MRREREAHAETLTQREAAEEMNPMSRGGARNRSGPQADPSSGRSDARGFTLSALPSEGYSGEVPPFPIGPTVTDDLTGMREVQVWAEAWTTPQACAWSQERWRWPIIAEYCRLKAIVEFSPAASAALVGQLHRYRDQIGLTPAGLKENGWKIAADEVAAKARDPKPATAASSVKSRLRAVASDGGA